MRRSVLLIFLLTIPAFFRMLRPGIFSMQDFHLFRLYEFDRCFRDFQLPCRWAPDAGFGYGEPVFNFYTQFPYLVGEISHLVGFQLIDSIKILFILTFVGSAVSMYFLAKQIWGNNLSAILAAAVYIYAPYRAVDVWVRGALPEAIAFIIFPIIIFFINDFFSTKRLRSLILLSFSLALLLITHNLSFLMFMPVLIIWMSFLIFTNKQWKLVLPVVGSFIFALLISAFYILPVIFEGKFIQLDLTTRGYFDFRGHFTTVYQLLISRFWGYGASLFGPVDDISLSVGQVQWLLPIFVLLGLMLKKRDDWKKLAVFILIGWFALFMSHNKSAFVWENLPFLAYLQFPWRWLSIATFSFAIAAGGFALLFKNRYQKLLVGGAVLLTVLVNIPFFKEDIWKDVGDKEIFSGKSWEEQIAASLPDYWPNFGKDLPSAPAREGPTVLEGQGSAVLVSQDSANREYKINIDSGRGKVQFPVVFFPGWKGKVNGNYINIFSDGNLGLITTELSQGTYSVFLTFRNTPIRTIGNIISILSFVTFILFLKLAKNKQYVR